MFFTFFKLYKWYEIVKRNTIGKGNERLSRSSRVSQEIGGAIFGIREIFTREICDWKKTSATSIDPCAREHTWTYDHLQELHKYFELFIHEGKNGD